MDEPHPTLSVIKRGGRYEIGDLKSAAHVAVVGSNIERISVYALLSAI